MLQVPNIGFSKCQAFDLETFQSDWGTGNDQNKKSEENRQFHQ